MKRALVLVSAFAAIVLVVSGCSLLGGTGTVTGSTSPYTHTTTIDSLSLDGDAVVDVNFGNVE